MTSGRQIRDYLDVGEAGRLIADTALGAMQGPVNICSGVAVTIRALAERIADEYGRRDLLCFGARPDNLGDPPCRCRRARRKLARAPRYTASENVVNHC